VITYHELFLNSPETLEPRCELKVVIRRGFSNGGDDGDVISFRANIMGARNNCNIDI